MRIVLLLLLVLFGTHLGAQVDLHTDDYASSGSNSAKNIVRDSGGNLHCLSLLQTSSGERQLIVQSSSDGGISWSIQPQVLNDDNSGLFGPDPASQCSLAIDDQNTLHLLWGRYTYPSYFRQFYRRFDPATGSASDIIEFSLLSGAPLNARTSAMDIIVDGENSIWISVHDPASWVEHLWRSDEPYAAGDTFSDLGAISPGNSAQNTRLAVDSAGRIHCSFYRNIGAGQYEHRIYDPLSGWQVDSNILGDTGGTNDYYGWLAADALGYVHSVHVIDAPNTSPLWTFRYRRWEEGSGWGPEVILFTATSAQYTGISSYRIFNLGCDEETGKVHAVYRDLSQDGALVIAEKELDDDAFTVVDELQPANPSEHVYIYPKVRGTLFPAANNFSHGFDVTYQWREVPGSPPYTLIYHDAGGNSGVNFIRGDCNEDGGFNIADTVYGLNALFVPGSPPPGCLEECDINDDGSFNIADMVYGLNALFVPASPSPSAPFPDCGSDPIAPSLDCPTGSAACP